LSTVALLPSTAVAQQIFSPTTQDATGNAGGVQERDVPICQVSGGGSRTRRMNCDQPELKTERTEVKLKLPLEAPEPPTAQCEATTTTEYQQRNTMARVDSTLAIKNCAAVTGTLTFLVRIRDESGEIKPLEFNETWQRSDDEDVKFMAEYPIGDNVNLVSVRVRDLHCTCADSPTEQAGPKTGQ
jgi:hypothetical protein